MAGDTRTEDEKNKNKNKNTRGGEVKQRLNLEGDRTSGYNKLPPLMRNSTGLDVI